jgi:hypothetical protein
MSDDGNINFQSYTRAQLQDALSRIDRERYPQNYKKLVAELSSRRDETFNVVALPPKPRSVSYAIWLLWATLALGALRMLIIFPYMPKGLSFGITVAIVIAVMLVLFLLYWWLLSALSRGRNWARITLLVLFLGWLFVAYDQFITAFSRSMLEGSIFTLQQFLDTAALAILFSRSSRDWFRVHAQATASDT